MRQRDGRRRGWSRGRHMHACNECFTVYSPLLLLAACGMQPAAADARAHNVHRYNNRPYVIQSKLNFNLFLMQNIRAVLSTQYPIPSFFLFIINTKNLKSSLLALLSTTFKTLSSLLVQ